MSRRSARWIVVRLLAPVVVPVAHLAAADLPSSAPLDEVEVTIAGVAHGLLDEGCEYGSHREVIGVRGTGRARLTFEILGGDCAPETREFEVPPKEVETMLRELVELEFHRLAPDYRGRRSLCVDCVPGEPPGTLFRVDTDTTHAADVTVTLRFADFERAVHYSAGATAAGLSEWVARWRPRLWRHAGFLRHFAPRER